ncbi:MAG: ABC transporter permease [Chitinophagaceae bacterium]|nr:ABC transporter permease [Chitinophagaceae bacterium]
MNKILIISKREFLTRVQKKTFLLTTIGLPLLIFGIYALIIFFAVNDDKDYNIAVADEAKIFQNNLQDRDKEFVFTYVNNETPESLIKALDANKYKAFIYVPKNFSSTDSIQVVASKSIGFITQNKIERSLENALEENKLLVALNVTKPQLDSLQKTNNIKFTTINGEKDSEVKAGISYGVGMFSGFLIYIILFIYGTMVMRGVAEEKTNRIAEVIISSVKPFQLMMGKIIGIGSVGLLQFLIWVFLVFGLQIVLTLFFPDVAGQIQQQPMQPGMIAATNAIEQSNALSKLNTVIAQINFPLLISCFIFYFLGGYFMYASLFAAVGSTVNEDPNDAQTLTLPITMPIIFGFAIMMQAVNNPNSSLAVFGSLFPLTSPIVMMARVAHGVPDGVTIFQLILSMVLLVFSFIGTTWVAAKIYRTGILMYGKKVTLKEMIKWTFRKS